MARFDSIVTRLPRGLETDVREKGVTLSGGERQRLALARGILAAQNSTILLMDEPTSSVDAQNEMAIYDAVFKHFSEQSIISSIHRLHLLHRFDQVVVMVQGKIVQRGKFQDLKNQTGPLAEMWQKYKDSEDGYQ